MKQQDAGQINGRKQAIIGQQQVIIVAGGQGMRMGASMPKQFLPVVGVPVLVHTMRRFAEAFPENLSIVLVLPAEQIPYWQELCVLHQIDVPMQVVAGGKTRFESVRNGIAACMVSGLIGVHDGVRPFVDVEVIRNTYAAAELTGAAIPVLPLTDSLRRVEDTGNRIANRAEYRLVQTPQVFQAELLHRAYAQEYNDAFTDDASVVEAYGHAITLVEGNTENIKITTPYDLKLAEWLINAENGATTG